MATTHHLKCAAPYFDAVGRGDKTFEIRKDDRGFQAGDMVVLTRVDEVGDAFVGMPWEQRSLDLVITFVLRGGQFGIEPGYVAMAVRLVEVPGVAK